MQTIEYRTVDKSNWPRGEWDSEPDKAQWPDPATGLPCLIVRGPGGALCGYVGIPKSHPWHGKDYSHLYDENASIEVHGGLTFADSCHHEAAPDSGICHIPEAGEPDDVWWFGFDCAHSGDVSPKYERNYGRGHYGWYKDIAYVRLEVTRLAQQLAAASQTPIA